MNYTIAAIPTMYNGVQFRSRLEARWAAFFDLNGWKWEYEPIDLNGWIPDFVLRVEGNSFYVEVKPIFECDHETISKIVKSLPDDKNHNLWKNCILLGNQPFIAPMNNSNLCDSYEVLGYISSNFLVPEEMVFYPAPWKISDISSTYQESGHGCYMPEDPDILGYASRWKEAGNIVQWKGKRS